MNLIWEYLLQVLQNMMGVFQDQDYKLIKKMDILVMKEVLLE